jgi:hypothetical protein
MAKSRKTFQRLGVKEYQRQEASAQRKVYKAIEEYRKLAEVANEHKCGLKSCIPSV